MAEVGQAYPGKLAEVTVDQASLYGTDANVEEHGDDIDGTNFQSNGLDVGTVGPTGLTYDIKGNWQNQGDPPGASVRPDLPGVTITPGGSMPTARVLSSKISVPIRGKVEYNFSGKSQGSYTTSSQPNPGNA